MNFNLCAMHFLCVFLQRLEDTCERLQADQALRVMHQDTASASANLTKELLIFTPQLYQ